MLLKSGEKSETATAAFDTPPDPLAKSREERFEDVNREIVRVSDVLVCILRAGSEGQTGGSEDLVRRAVQRGKPVLVITVGVADGKPALSEQWRLPERLGKKLTTAAEAFDLPVEPETLTGVRFTGANEGKAGKTLIDRYVM